MKRWTFYIAFGVLIIGSGLGAYWFLSHQATGVPTGPSQEATTQGPNRKHMEQPPKHDHKSSTPASESPPATAPNTLTIAPERLQTIGVRFEEAAHRPLARTIRTVGRVEIDERRLARVNIKFEGWIEDLRVSAIGDHVKQHQILFTIYSPDLVATQEEYLLALQGIRELGTSEFPVVAKGAKDLLEATRRRFQLWDITENHIQDLERTGEVLRTLPIHSPITGTVLKMEARAGTHVTPGTELYMIADLSRIWIMADIYEYELPLIQLDQKATVTLSYDPQTHLVGSVGFIYPTLDPQTRTAKVRFEVKNPGEKLKPGMYANVELTIPLGRRLAIPRDAVLETGERQVVFIHHGGGTLEWRDAKLGVQAGEWVEVLEGVKEGDHIVTSANFLIDSESQLKSAIRGMAGMKH
ncbi:MAG: efflux RND transporter periplasmic adaptor subunit [Nitrospirota bacterium]|nr:efflux RND transporter periplasmic adaptor subunit [Nitrospirota bacterium]